MTYVAVRDKGPEAKLMQKRAGWQCVAQSHGWQLYRNGAPASGWAGG